MPNFTVGTRVQITDEYHRTGEVGYVEKVCHHQNGISYLVKFRDGQVSSFFESSVVERPYTGHLKKTLQDYVNIGAIISGFVEAEFYGAEILREATGSYSIRPVTQEDVASKHFRDWFFKIADMVDEDPKQFPFEIITHCEYFHVYGYFHGDNLDAIIKVVEDDDDYELTWFFVNGAVQGRGIGQRLFQFVLNKYVDKKLTLSVYKDNDPAIHIYKKYGFKIVGIGIGNCYKPDAPFYIMQRDSPEQRKKNLADKLR